MRTDQWRALFFIERSFATNSRNGKCSQQRGTRIAAERVGGSLSCNLAS